MAALANYSSMTDRRDGTQPRIPRLTYRCNPSTASISDQSIITTRTESSAASISTCATSPPTSSFHFSDDAPSPFSLDGACDSKPSPSSLSPQTAANEPKKNSSSFFKFFTVKEPSTQAFEAYQEQMKKRGTTQNGRANAVGLPGVSSAKLPATVPKVNSKWDGVPQTAKDKAKAKELTQRQSFSSVTRPVHTSQSNASNLTTSSTTSSSSSSSSSTRSDLRGNGKLRLDNSSGNLSDIYGWESPPTQSKNTSSSSLDHHHHHRPSHSRENSSSFSFSFFNNRPPTIPEASTEPEPASAGSTPPPLDPSSAHTSPAVTPDSMRMPQTPTDAVPALPLSHPHLPPPVKISSPEPVALASTGTNVLGPPVSATWKPKLIPAKAFL
ncbi:MAG: hypothetical protein Q9212_006143, partial [Teloschistes hypoglaucus]